VALVFVSAIIWVRRPGGQDCAFGCARSMIRRRVMPEEPYHRILCEAHPSAQLPPKAFVGLERAQFKQPFDTGSSVGGDRN
jgi:hypothetical protein